MEKLLKLIIADDEQFICGMLQKLIRFQELGLELTACANDGETLLSQIEEHRPDIVLTDISMPMTDGLEVIRQVREKNIPCRFVIISGYRQFEYAYNALKYDVEDYILKPVEGRELNRVLAGICDDIRHEELVDAQRETSRLQSWLIDKGVHEELKNDAMSLQEINQLYHTSFQHGLYRMLFLKMDFSREERRLEEDVSSVVNKLDELVHTAFAGLCYDVVTAKKRDGVMFLLNYSGEWEAAVLKEIRVLYVDAKNVIELFEGFYLTFCIGKAVDSPQMIEETKTSCRRADWIRMNDGLNRIIFSEEVEEAAISGFGPKLDEIRDKLEKSFHAMDAEAMREQISRFFSLPVQILCCTESMLFIRRVITRFGEVYSQAAKVNGAEEIVLKKITSKLHVQTDFEGYQNALIEGMAQIMSEMADTIREKNVKPVRRACAYIEQHYAEHLTLESMAQIVNLSPVYFSNLFKKEEGMNFTEYLTAYRMKVAKELLRAGDKNINEIADQLGYSDARYFSKVFKKEVGVKPTDYRKIYG